MNINWKVRLRNPLFIVQILASIGVPVLVYYGLTPQDLTTWGGLFDLIKSAFSNPYVLGMSALSLYNAIPDPTTDGLRDSKQALRYHEPKKEAK